MNTFETNANMPATVLIVDDDPGARLLLGTALEMAGFRVTCAADGASALKQFRSQPVDCVILDVVMPGMSGFDACSALRALPECRHVPILMQTSLDDMESVNRAYNAGATDFSSKGINPMLLAQRVKFLVRAKQTQDQLRESEARVRYLAYYDPLTALPNRQRLLQILEQHVAWAARAATRYRGIDAGRGQFFPHQRHARAAPSATCCCRRVANRLQYCLRDSQRALPPSDNNAESQGHQGLGCAHRRRRIRPGATRRVHGRQRPDGGAARATRLGEAVRLRPARGAAVGDHRHQYLSPRCRRRRDVDQQCRCSDASRQEGGSGRDGVLQEIHQHAGRQAAVPGSGFAQGAGAPRIHLELSAAPGAQGLARRGGRGAAALVASAARLGAAG